ncbi:MAG: hypothetical protein IJ217_03000 [Clostridia bacterium]|nr:hypothetical protein [Clostridia bacterium]
MFSIDKPKILDLVPWNINAEVKTSGFADIIYEKKEMAKHADDAFAEETPVEKSIKCLNRQERKRSKHCRDCRETLKAQAMKHMLKSAVSNITGRQRLEDERIKRYINGEYENDMPLEDNILFLSEAF